MVIQLMIKTPSRLHFTLIDLNGSRGRLDGGVGLTLKEPALIIQLRKIDQAIKVTFNEDKGLDSNLKKEYSHKIKTSATNILQYFNLDPGFEFLVQKTFPPHSGLGSGTQISLATAKLLMEFHHLNLESKAMGQLVGRGGTSGIGVAAFMQGGFIVDGGHKIEDKPEFLPSSASQAPPPPIISRHDFPDHWKIILAIPEIQEKVSGKKEVNIFQKYCPLPLREVETVSHLILMKMIPAILEHDLDNLGKSINEIQNIGFKKVEMNLQNELITKIIETMKDAGAAGAGMSSFGPTTYAITDTNSKNIIKAIQETVGDTPCYLLTTQAQNRGAQLI